MATVHHLEHVWTTHEQYLVLFISVENFIGIDAVVTIIR